MPYGYFKLKRLLKTKSLKTSKWVNKKAQRIIDLTGINILTIQNIDYLIESYQASAALEKLAQITPPKKAAALYRYHTSYAKALKQLGHPTQSLMHRINALDINPSSLTQWDLAITLEEKTLSSVVFDYYCQQKEKLPEEAKLFIEAKLSCSHTTINFNWEEAITFSNQHKYNALFINTLITTALIKNQAALSDIEALLFNKLTTFNKPLLLRSFRQLALAYYKVSNTEKLLSLSEKVTFADETWKLAIAFGTGSPIEGLTHRSKILSSAFSNFYTGKINTYGTRTLFPEKDLCGDIFLPFFFKSEFTQNGNFRVIADERLCGVLKRSFPYLQFIPKTPQRKKTDKPEMFKGMPDRLTQYIDLNTLKHINDSKFITIPYNNFFNDKICKNNKHFGWLIPDNKKVTFWQEFFKPLNGQKLIGFCANSTLQNPSRNMHMVDLAHWESIFNIPNTRFINLNPNLPKSDLEYFQNKFDIEIINIESVDLYNDFESLLAIMKVIDFAIVPSNNMMDMAASIALDSLVFSPTNIMSNWTINNEENYLFSDHVHFITPLTEDESRNSMARRAAAYITKQLFKT